MYVLTISSPDIASITMSLYNINVYSIAVCYVLRSIVLKVLKFLSDKIPLLHLILGE